MRAVVSGVLLAALACWSVVVPSTGFVPTGFLHSIAPSPRIHTSLTMALPDQQQPLPNPGGDAMDKVIENAYLNWCKAYRKQPDKSRFPQFSANYRAMAEVANRSGNKMPALNEFADCSREEYSMLQQLKQVKLTQGQKVRMHKAYDQWCRLHDKEPDEERFITFAKNFQQIEQESKASGKPFKLNAYTDLSPQEFRALQEKPSAPANSNTKNTPQSNVFTDTRSPRSVLNSIEPSWSTRIKPRSTSTSTTPPIANRSDTEVEPKEPQEAGNASALDEPKRMSVEKKPEKADIKTSTPRADTRQPPGTGSTENQRLMAIEAELAATRKELEVRVKAAERYRMAAEKTKQLFVEATEKRMSEDAARAKKLQEDKELLKNALRQAEEEKLMRMAAEEAIQMFGEEQGRIAAEADSKRVEEEEERRATLENELSNLEAESQKKIDEEKQKRVMLEKARQEIVEEADELRDELEQLRVASESERRVTLAEMKGKIGLESEKRRAAEKAKSEAEEGRSKLTAEIDSLRRLIEEQKQAAAKSQAALDAQLETEMKERASMEATLKKLAEAQRELAAEMAAREKELLAEQEKNAALLESTRQLEIEAEKRKAMQKAKENLDEATAELNQEIETLRAELQEQEKEARMSISEAFQQVELEKEKRIAAESTKSKANATIEEFSEQVKHLRSELENQQKEMSSSLTSASQQVELEREKRAAAENAKLLANSTLSQLTADISVLRRNLDDQRQEANDSVAATTKKLATEKERRVEAEQAKRQANSTISVLEEQLETMRNELQEQEHKLQNSSVPTEQLEKERQQRLAAEHAKERFNATLAALRKEMKVLQTETEQQQQQAATAMTNLSQELQAEKEKRQSAEQRKRQTNATNADLTAQVENLLLELQQEKEQVNSSQSATAQQLELEKKKRTVAEQSLRQSNATVVELLAEVTSLQEEIAKQQLRANASLSDALGRLDVERKKRKATEQARQNASDSASKSSEVVAALRNELGEREKQASAAISEAEKRLAAEKQKYDALEKALEEADRVASELDREILKLRTELEERLGNVSMSMSNTAQELENERRLRKAAEVAKQQADSTIVDLTKEVQTLRQQAEEQSKYSADSMSTVSQQLNEEKGKRLEAEKAKHQSNATVSDWTEQMESLRSKTDQELKELTSSLSETSKQLEGEKVQRIAAEKARAQSNATVAKLSKEIQTIRSTMEEEVEVAKVAKQAASELTREVQSLRLAARETDAVVSDVNVAADTAAVEQQSQLTETMEKLNEEERKRAVAEEAANEAKKELEKGSAEATSLRLALDEQKRIVSEVEAKLEAEKQVRKRLTEVEVKQRAELKQIQAQLSKAVKEQRSRPDSDFEQSQITEWARAKQKAEDERIRIIEQEARRRVEEERKRTVALESVLRELEEERNRLISDAIPRDPSGADEKKSIFSVFPKFGDGSGVSSSTGGAELQAAKEATSALRRKREDEIAAEQARREAEEWKKIQLILAEEEQETRRRSEEERRIIEEARTKVKSQAPSDDGGIFSFLFGGNEKSTAFPAAEKESGGESKAADSILNIFGRSSQDQTVPQNPAKSAEDSSRNSNRARLSLAVSKEDMTPQSKGVGSVISPPKDGSSLLSMFSPKKEDEKDITAPTDAKREQQPKSTGFGFLGTGSSKKKEKPIPAPPREMPPSVLSPKGVSKPQSSKTVDSSKKDSGDLGLGWFSKQQAPVSAATTGRPTKSVISAIKSQPRPPKSQPPSPVAKVQTPTISMWSQNDDGSITGFVTMSQQFRTGEKITTAPVKEGVVGVNKVISTVSGSKYKLGVPAVRSSRKPSASSKPESKQEAVKPKADPKKKKKKTEVSRATKDMPQPTAASPYPLISKWTRNSDGSVTGFVSNSKSFRNGEKITTSPIRMALAANKVVSTASGSKYKLGVPASGGGTAGKADGDDSSKDKKSPFSWL